MTADQGSIDEADALNDPWHTAVHEAGHAVIGRKLGLDMGQASVLQDDDAAGHSIVGDPYVTLDRWWHEGRTHREFGSVVRARVMMLMAGAEVEIAILGRMQMVDSDTLDGEDRREIDRVMENHPGDPAGDADRLVRMRRVTRRLALRHLEEIERIAAVLLERGVVPGHELDEMAPGPRAREEDPMRTGILSADLRASP
ncbi:MAG: hypothetical protein ACRYGP_29960 [Janthinobacterium lividum]